MVHKIHILRLTVDSTCYLFRFTTTVLQLDDVIVLVGTLHSFGFSFQTVAADGQRDWENDFPSCNPTDSDVEAQGQNFFLIDNNRTNET